MHRAHIAKFAAVLIGLSAPAAHADPRDDRKACWETYSICAIGAADVAEWRSVCYSDFTGCMRRPPDVECLPEDEDMCRGWRARCEVRGSGRNGGTQCGEDYQVCLDALGC
jgi:hypothetical protein